MRLTEQQITAICEAFSLYFLKEDHIWLFGSRVDDHKKGGDIDLYIETHYEDHLLVASKEIDFLIKLKSIIGDQKIDLVINAIKSSKKLPIYDEAKKTGVMII